MIIPIHIRYKYTNYPNAPRATAKSKTLGLLTSVFMQILYGIIWVGIIFYLVEKLNIDSEILMIVGLISLAPLYIGIHFMKKRLTRKIDAMAVAETVKRLQMTPAELAAHDLTYQKRYLKRGAIACIIMSMIFLIYPITDLPFTASRLSDVSVAELEAGTAYLSDQDLLILNEYAEGNDGKQLYYTAITYDNKGQLVLLSAEFGSNTEIGKRMEEYSDIQIEDMIASGYFRAEKIEDQSYALKSYYNDACKQLSDFDVDFQREMMNLRYICDADESLTLHSISAGHIITIAMGVFFLIAGCLTLRKQRRDLKQSRANDGFGGEKISREKNNIVGYIRNI